MEKKPCEEKNDFDGKIGEKRNVYHLPEAAPPPPKSSTRAIYISKIGMAAKQHFLN